MAAFILFKERSTDLIYEAQFGDDGMVLTRPASADFADAIERMTIGEFDERFDEFWGHPEEYMVIPVHKTAQ